MEFIGSLIHDGSGGSDGSTEHTVFTLRILHDSISPSYTRSAFSLSSDLSPGTDLLLGTILSRLNLTVSISSVNIACLAAWEMTC